MLTGSCYWSFLFAGAMLAVPIWSYAGSVAQKNSAPVYKLNDDGAKQSDSAKHNSKRYFDRGHKDYHVWDEHEADVYRRWLLEERKEPFRDFGRMKTEQQSEYWRWRHDHPDSDGDRR